MIKTILLQKDSIHDVTTNINVILSPTFYWTRIFEIPINSKKEALTVVPNLFEEFITAGIYAYEIQKLEDNKYLCFAYNENTILDSLEKAKIKLKNVENLYFAQNEFLAFNDEVAIEYGNEKYIYQNDVLIKVPNNLLLNVNTKIIDIESLKLSKKTISINKTSKYIENKTAYALSSLLMVFSCLIFFKSYLIMDEIKTFETKKSELYSKYNLLPSQLQTKSVIKNYKKIENTNVNFREKFEYFVNFKNKMNAKLENIEYAGNTLTVYYSNTTLNTVKNYMNKKYKVVSITTSNKFIKVGIKI
jgi:hypothetical protein